MRFTGLVIERTEARSRLQWVVLFRFVVIIVCLAALSLRRGGASFTPAMAWGFWLLVAACALNVLHALLLRTTRHPAWWGFGHALLDTVVVSILIYLTGGSLSYFNVLYFAAILSAGWAISGRTGLFFASLSTVLLSIVSTTYFLADYYDWPLPLIPRYQLRAVVGDLHFVLSYLLAQGAAYHVVAFLALLLEQRARRSELLQATLLRDISEGVIALDNRGRFLYMNDEARKLLGFPPLVPVIGKHWDQVFRRVSDRPLRDMLFSQQSLRRTIELDRSGGKVLVNVKTSVMMDESSQRVMAVLGDLSVHQRAAAAERRADQLEQVAEMAASMAHELRNPLTSIRACAQEFGRLQPVDEDTQKLIQIICRESDRLDRVISDFLGFARMRSPNLRRGDASRTLKEVAQLLEQRVQPPTTCVDLEVESPLPCSFDAEQLQQALMNIGVNAIEAIEGGGSLRICGRALRTEVANGQVLLPNALSNAQGIEITFSDTGPGIPPDNLERIFTPFFTTKKSGTGLGLAIASRIIKAHGGRIDVSSEPDQGAAFAVWLPPPEEHPPATASGGPPRGR